MKLTQFLYDRLVKWDTDWEMDPEEYPFEVKEEDTWQELENKAEAWEKEHGLEEVEDKVIDYDLEKAYVTKRMVFKLDEHYYVFEYDYSYYWDDPDMIGIELQEVHPVEKTITVYE
jgi:hypothetical protein